MTSNIGPKIQNLTLEYLLLPQCDPPGGGGGGGGGAGGFPSNRPMGMCCWMGSHFQGWIDYNGVAFSLALLEWDRTFSGFGESDNSGR